MLPVALRHLQITILFYEDFSLGTMKKDAVLDFSNPFCTFFYWGFIVEFVKGGLWQDQQDCLSVVAFPQKMVVHCSSVPYDWTMLSLGVEFSCV